MPTAFIVRSMKTTPRQLCIVTGLSGAGKSTAIGVFEDLNFFAVDGLPASLSPEMTAMMSRPAMCHYDGMALGMDLREHNFMDELELALLNLSSHEMAVRLLFLEASETELLRRYAFTRRPHPLEKKGFGLAHAISSEREQLKPLRGMADVIIDSTGFSIHDMRRAIQRHFGSGAPAEHSLKINLLSFGYKYGIPEDADFVFDMRFLPNPFFVDSLKPLSGKDEAVAEYVFAAPLARELRQKTYDYFQFLLPQIEEEGRRRVTIAIGCTGGRHRSVAMAEKLAESLRKDHYEVLLEHRNLNDDPKNISSL